MIDQERRLNDLERRMARVIEQCRRVIDLYEDRPKGCRQFTPDAVMMLERLCENYRKIYADP